MQKPGTLLRANSTLAKNENKKAIPFPIASKKRLWINFTKEIKEIYKENYETLKKDIEDDTKELNDISST